MAIRHREGRKKPWEVYWKNPFTFKRESLYVGTKEEAKKQDALKKYQLKFERDLFRPAEEEAVQVEQTLESAFYLYLKERQLSQKSFRSILEAMGASLRFYGQKPVVELTATDLKTLKEHLSTMGTRGTTVRRRLCVLRTVLRWCEANSLIPAVPSFPPLPSANYEKFIPPTQEEVSRIFTCAAPHIQRVIVLGTQCGVRIGPSELLKIKWSDVDLNRSVIHVPAAKKNTHEPWRDVPIKSELLPVFEEWLRHDAACGAEYLIHYKGRHVEHIKMAWRGALRRAGITRRIRPYDLRHAFATEAIAAGVDIGTVAKLMGHSSPMMLLKHYQHVMDSQKRAAIEALPRAEYVAKNMWQKRTHSDKDT